MADTYEQNLGQKSSLTTSDFIRVVGSDNVSYKQLLSNVLATGGMGELITSSGGWQSDNAKTAFENAYASWANNTVHVGVIRAGSVAIYIACKADAQYGAVHFLTYGSGFAQEYTRNIYGGTWGDIIVLPTRAEIDALNNKTQISTDPATGITLETNAIIKKGNVCNLRIVTNPVSISSGTKIATIPDNAYKPYTSCLCIASDYSTGIPVGTAYVSPNGVTYYGNSVTNKKIEIFCSYIA